MCGLFGFVHYGSEPLKDLASLTNVLAEHAAIRGTDATGIAYGKSGIQIHKEAKAAYAIQFKHPDTIPALIGHTRHATHGDARKNYNNHPFFGRAGSTRFALAHNGVLWNSLLTLPKTKIETDSYAAVQLLEQQKALSFDSLRTMAEAVSGSFSFSILDDKNRLWLVKGDSPLSLLHFPEPKLYVYASTEEILYRAMVESFLFPHIRRQQFEEIPIPEGTILQIRPDGHRASEPFRFCDRARSGWWEYGFRPVSEPLQGDGQSYLDAIRITASCLGIDPEQIDELLASGFTPEEIEEAMYEI